MKQRVFYGKRINLYSEFFSLVNFLKIGCTLYTLQILLLD